MTPRGHRLDRQLGDTQQSRQPIQDGRLQARRLSTDHAYSEVGTVAFRQNRRREPPRPDVVALAVRDDGDVVVMTAGRPAGDALLGPSDDDSTEVRLVDFTGHGIRQRPVIVESRVVEDALPAHDGGLLIQVEGGVIEHYVESPTTRALGEHGDALHPGEVMPARMQDHTTWPATTQACRSRTRSCLHRWGRRYRRQAPHSP